MVKWEWKPTWDNTGKRITQGNGLQRETDYKGKRITQAWEQTGFTVSLLACCVHGDFSTENNTRYTHPSSPEPMAITTLVI